MLKLVGRDGLLLLGVDGGIGERNIVLEAVIGVCGVGRSRKVVWKESHR